MSNSTAPTLSRRRFLQTTAIAAAASASARPAMCADDLKAGAIDAHIHVWTPDIKRYPLASGFKKADMQPPSFTPEQFFEHAKPVGVTRTVLIQMSFYGTDNRYMLETMRRYPGVFSGVAVIDENDRPARRMIELQKQGVRGFRIRPGDRKPDRWLSSEGMQTMWRVGAERGLAMCHLIDAEFLPSVDRMCQRYPETPVVIDHFARIGVDGRIRDEDVKNLARLARHKHAYVKVSAYYALGKKQPPYTDLAQLIRRTVDAFGPERCMWASDCPYQVQSNHTYKASIDLVRSGLEFLSAGDKDWVLRRTAETVYFA